MKYIHNSLTALAFGFASAALLFPIHQAEAGAMKVLDVQYSKKLCKAWNKTNLPKALGKNGSEWIDSNDSPGRQVMALTRSDCKNWPMIGLVIEADSKGNASCTDAVVLKKSDKYQWKMEPTSEQWIDFSDGFGVMAMPGLMGGFVGSYSTAMNNIGSFGMFFSANGYLAITSSADWTCDGADMEEVNEELEDLDHDDMMDNLKGMAILK